MANSGPWSKKSRQNTTKMKIQAWQFHRFIDVKMQTLKIGLATLTKMTVWFEMPHKIMIVNQ